MKIVVATTVGGLDDIVSPVFARSPTFTIVDVEGKEIKNSSVIQNQYAGAMSGAGIQAAQLTINQGAKAMIAGNYGPNSSVIFNQAGVEMVCVHGISVREAVKKYLEGELSPVTTATVPMFGGMGGMRRGGGGMGMRFMQPPMPSMPTKEQEIRMLETNIKTFEQQLSQIKKRIDELKRR